jgi:hypothetical protein
MDRSPAEGEGQNIFKFFWIATTGIIIIGAFLRIRQWKTIHDINPDQPSFQPNWWWWLLWPSYDTTLLCHCNENWLHCSRSEQGREHLNRLYLDLN